MLVLFYGRSALSFLDGFEALCAAPPTLVAVGDDDRSPAALRAFEGAEAVIGVHFRDPALAVPRLRLFQVAGAGLDAVDLSLLPPSATVCNCFGHEEGIGEYVLLAMLRHVVPIADADRRLRDAGDWHWSAATAGAFHDEIAGRTLGILGYGRIGRAVARRARAFDMEVVVANRSPVEGDDGTVDRYLPLDDLGTLYERADFLVCALPLTESTRSLVDAAAFARMRPTAFVINVGRGPVIDEEALYRALAGRRIAGACIDTWYVYPGAGGPGPQPSRFPFRELDNVVMTPHMSGWTFGTRRRRQRAMAENLNRLAAGEPLLNVVRAATGSP